MDRVAVIRSESDRLADLLGTLDPSATVPTCPEWTAADLLWHVAEVHHFWARILSDGVRDDAGVAEVESNKPERPTATRDVLAVRADATARLLGALERLDDEEIRWSWWPGDQTVGFTRRMQTCEATMHRVDAELTAGVAIGPIAQGVARGSVDHAVDVMWGWMPDWATYEPAALVELRATDTADSWLVEVGHWFGTGPESGNEFDVPRAVRASTGDAGLRVAASVEQLARWAWTRDGLVDVDGDLVARAALDALISNGMQ